MTSINPGPGQLICGAGGALLIVSLFLPWAGAADVDRSGWELWTMGDVFLVIVGLVAIGTTLTGGRFGLFRPDLSLIGAADLLGVIATILLAWLVVFDFPDGASREIGVFVSLIGAMAVAGAPATTQRSAAHLCSRRQPRAASRERSSGERLLALGLRLRGRPSLRRNGARR